MERTYFEIQHMAGGVERISVMDVNVDSINRELVKRNIEMCRFQIDRLLNKGVGCHFERPVNGRGFKLTTRMYKVEGKQALSA